MQFTVLWSLMTIAFIVKTIECVTNTTENVENEAKKRVQIVTTNGPIIGETIIVNTVKPNDRRLVRFLGIPYAEPPLGKLRFRRPRPITTKWTEPRETLRWPNVCIQRKLPLPEGIAAREMSTNTSEDCLYLNVWTPAAKLSTDIENIDTIKKDNDLRPVVVLIHGGGLLFGSSSFDLYNCETFAAMTDAVIVSMNYRLSILGFLYSDTVDDVRGNQGLWDQVLALKWVRNNIGAFGGDANRVTIMGQSAGGWSVSAHILSPQSRTLFRNAIMMSGASMGKMIVGEAARLQSKLLNGIRAIDCATEQDTSINQKVIECLEKLPAESVENVKGLADKEVPKTINQLMVVDGEFFTAKPHEMLAARNYKTDVKLLASSVENEASFALSFMFPQFRATNPAPLPLDDAKSLLVDVLSKLLIPKIISSVDARLIQNVYFSGLTELNAQDRFRRQVGIALGDVFLGCSVLRFAKEVFRHSPKTAIVYQWYYRAQMGNVSKWFCNQWAGACHCDDLYPVFGVPFRLRKQFLTREREISNEVINFISSFIRDGTPGQDQPEWLPYFANEEGTEVIAPYYEINNGPKTSENFKFNLKNLECDVIWSKYII